MELSIIIFSVFFFFLFSGTGEAYSALIQRQTTTNNNNKLTTQELIELLETVPDEGKNKFIKDNVNLGFKIEFLKEPWENHDEAQLATKIFHYYLENREEIGFRKLLKNNQALIADVFCFPDPIGCIDTDDGGLHPIV
ncbi:hypothetical protein ABEB36_001821 [Hypothenemus hampei]|uniref:Uncharacterized protein n=1 Tax=Hypothenemus hampei TaxID=57062 RepID=A0ABD1FFU0_HYPHA